MCWSRLSACWSTLKSKWRCAEECLSHIGVWGSNMWIFIKRSSIKKGGASWGDEDRLHRPQVDLCARQWCPLACLSPFVGVKVLLVLHVLESRFREEDHLLIKALCGLIITQGQVKMCRRERLPSGCMGEYQVNLHRSAIEEGVASWGVEDRQLYSSTSSGLMRKAKIWSW